MLGVSPNMWRRSVISGQNRRRALLAVFVVCGTFLIAHVINGVVGDTLMASVNNMTADPYVAGIQLDRRTQQAVAQERVQVILSSGLFPLPTPEQIAAARGGIPATAPVTPMNVATKISLLGIVGGTGEDARAVLEQIGNKQQGLYRLTDHVPDIGQLAAIEKDRVLFRAGEQQEWLDLAIIQQRGLVGSPLQPLLTSVDGAPARTKNKHATRRTISRSQLIEVTGDPQAYLMEARFQPHFASGKLDGFQVDGIRQVGLLDQAGLQNQDVLAAVNNVEIRDPGKLWEIFKQLQHERTVRLHVVRHNQPLTLMVDIRG
ncbi:exported protein of unknown function [Nitrospira sp. KM1]|uniref:type II secretion system protein N n=1 Tax=Nitrospira sp. KM1 TaxID=1936990 RepID=UPI0013A7414E|nr:type II secretion system protein N [Nitrospira sp. KM1]BCA57090.1 exported protein of unknown function [Nitrospira sp. KM1]